mgnify:CR=1 FL=1
MTTPDPGVYISPAQMYQEVRGLAETVGRIESKVDSFLDEAKDIRGGRILDLPLSRLTSLRRAGFQVREMTREAWRLSPFEARMRPAISAAGMSDGASRSITARAAATARSTSSRDEAGGEGCVLGGRRPIARGPIPSAGEVRALANQLLFTDAANEGRTPLVKRFAEQAFGTINVSNHGSYCGQSFRVGTGAAMGDIKGMPHGKPDWKNARFGLFIGAAPAQSGNPFQRQGRELAEARSRPAESAAPSRRTSVCSIRRAPTNMPISPLMPICPT